MVILDFGPVVFVRYQQEPMEARQPDNTMRSHCITTQLFGFSPVHQRSVGWTKIE